MQNLPLSNLFVVAEKCSLHIYSLSVRDILGEPAYSSSQHFRKVLIRSVEAFEDKIWLQDLFDFWSVTAGSIPTKEGFLEEQFSSNDFSDA